MGTFNYDKTLKEKIVTNFTFEKEIDNSFSPCPKIELIPFSTNCPDNKENSSIRDKDIYFIKRKSNRKDFKELKAKIIDENSDQRKRNSDELENHYISRKSEELNSIISDNNFNNDIKNELNAINQQLNALNIKAEEIKENSDSNERNININIQNESNVNNRNEENVYNNIENISNNEDEDIFLNKKRNRANNSSYINKIIRKIRIMVIKSIFLFINNTIKEKYDDDIGKSVIIKQLLKMDNKNLHHSKVEFDKEFLNKKLKDILSEKISGKYTNFQENKNKDLVRSLIEDSEKGGEYFKQLFELSFLNCLKHIAGEQNLDILNGLMKVDEILRYEEFKIDEDEFCAYKFYFKHYESRINDKKPRKSKNERNSCA